MNSENQDKQKPQILFKTQEAPDCFNGTPLSVREIQGLCLRICLFVNYELEPFY